MQVILVTGGVHADVGKGCAAAVLGRLVARAGRRVVYRKLEPCLQGPIEALTNRHFGEVVVGPAGAHDGDVARAAFLIPGFVPGPDADLSLGRALELLLGRVTGQPAPRLLELGPLLAASLSGPEDVLVVEVGGTAGEPEHRLLLDAFVRGLGRPSLHVHVTTLVAGAHGRLTTKPGQLSLGALATEPDLVLVRRGRAEDLGPLQACLAAGTQVALVGEDPRWPERAFHRALLGAQAAWLRLGCSPREDPSFADSTGSALVVQIVDDGAGLAGYASLHRRLVTWSRGRILPALVEVAAVVPLLPVVRIGEGLPPRVQAPAGAPFLEVVPRESGRDPRDPAGRPDWLGTADAAAGPVLEFVEQVLESAAGPPAPSPGGAAYHDAGFAAAYVSVSRSGGLRDHALLDPLVRAALPSPRRLVGAKVLDLGCGDGRWAARLVVAGAHVVGVEASAPMAALAAARGLERFELIRGDVAATSLPRDQDAALAILSLDHVEQAGRALERCAEALRPRGRLVLAVEHPLRSATARGPRWVADQAGRAARVQDYGASGWRRFAWFDPPRPVAVFHRPFGDWLTLVRAAGLEIVATHEPVADDPRDGGVPRFLLLVAERPGPRARLVVIDGPSGAGKTTLGDAVATALGWVHLDTGRVARAFAVREASPRGRASKVHVAGAGRTIRHFVDDEDVSDRLAAPEVGLAAASLLRDPAVEAEYDALVLGEIGRLSVTGCVVTARGLGRDLPQAEVRVWLDVPTDVRAARVGEPALARDAEDQARSRLTLADPASIRLDGTRPVAELVGAVLRLRQEVGS